jgi:hypothetical protein
MQVRRDKDNTEGDKTDAKTQQIQMEIRQMLVRDIQITWMEIRDAVNTNTKKYRRS